MDFWLSYITVRTPLEGLDAIHAYPHAVVHGWDAIVYRQLRRLIRHRHLHFSTLNRRSPLAPCPLPLLPTLPSSNLLPSDFITIRSLTSTVVTVEVATAHGAARADNEIVGGDLHTDVVGVAQWWGNSAKGYEALC